VDTCTQHIKRTLALAGGWVEPAALAAGQIHSATRLEDTLAGLVLAKELEYNERLRSYRLAGTPLARRALRLLAQQNGQGAPRQVLGLPDKPAGMYRFGVALRQAAAGGGHTYTMAELEMPLPKGADGAQALASGVAAWANCAALQEPTAQATGTA
jgi:hypothetical protein